MEPASRTLQFRHWADPVPKPPEIDPYRGASGEPSDGPFSPYLCRFLASRKASAKVLCKQEVAGSIPAGSISKRLQRPNSPQAPSIALEPSEVQ